ncbi:T9SS type B sorting domain-containing protein [uncultured Flavobacterium sp.]|uniref:T9SS type B sorting domain-containing protein n=1 Tax=uncultured Flavobacterium sp. TaxID=165435 RepID=UPI0030ECEDCB
MSFKEILFYFFITFSVFVNAQTTAIPDANFEQQLISLGHDTNGLNGNILNVDAQAVTTLTLTGNTITDLTGLQAFVNVVTLNLGSNQFATIPTNTLVNLEELVFNNNLALASIDLSNNLNLKKLDMRAPGSGSSGPITLIDLSNNIQLEYIHIYAFYSLQNVIFPVTNTVEYVYLLMFANITVDFSGYDNLENLSLSTNFNNSFAISVVLPTNQNTLQSASFQGGNIVNANFSTQLALEFLSMQSTNTQTLSLPVTTTLKTIRISSHLIDNVSFANASELDDLSITSKSVNIPLNIDISQNLLLKKLNTSNNYMTVIDVTQNTILEDMNVSNNQLTNLNLTQNILLENLNANRNLLPTLNLNQNTALETLTVNNNLLPNLDITPNILLNSVDISYNLFNTTGLDLTQNTSLVSLNASFNQIESLNILQNITLRNLLLNNNLFTGTSILDQFFTVRQNDIGYDQGIIGYTFNVSFNQLSGNMPDFHSLFSLGTGIPVRWTRRFNFYFHNNNFEFGHFENQHDDYVVATNTYVPTTFTSPVMSNYWYAPQAKVNTIDTINANAGDAITLTTVVSGAQNHYVWFKDGVQIPGAPDSPNYVINNVNSCDIGVYHSEIRSDLVPFDNANAPGTSGKNLLLVRNDITLNVNYTSSCVTLNSPANGATNVPINGGISWNGNPGACGYFVSIGTTPGGTSIANNIDVGDVTTYNLGTNFPPNTLIYVTITPYFQTGATLVCTSESFTTSAVTVLPDCTTLSFPTLSATDVPVDANITWIPSINATGYFISIGTTSGGTEIVNMLDVGNVTTYNPINDLPGGVQIYVTIIPYNNLGNAAGCLEESFTTYSNVSLPLCTTLISPINTASNVSVSSNFSWNAVADATGYFISYGTNNAANNIENMVDVGNVLTYNPPTDFPDETTIYVVITPYNSAGNSVGCNLEYFETEVVIPVCTSLTSPLNNATNISISSNISWNAVSNATGYFISYGTNIVGNNIANMIDVGNVLTFNPTNNFPDETLIYVSIIPYNSAGNAVGCSIANFETEVIIPICTSLTSPLNNATNVSISSNISWNGISNATGYFISYGTNVAGNNIINMIDVGNVLTYNPTNNFPDETTINVSIIPYNSAGNAIGCTIESFETEVVIPVCTSLTSPLNNATDVSISSTISWNAISNATGYFISYGTNTQGNNIANMIDVGNVLTYNPTNNFPDETLIYVSIIPYNSAGNAVGCSIANFETEVIIPICTSLTSPLNNATNVSISSNISWNGISNATGYFISYGTNVAGNNIINMIDVGNVLTYNPTNNFPDETTINVSIIPYNSAGNAIGCTIESFETEVVIPVCTSLTSPLNNATDVSISSTISWNAISNATGYFISYGTNTQGNNIANMIDVGNVLTYNPTNNFPDETLIYVTIIPHNSAGNAIGCSEESFETEVVIPVCTNLTLPLNNTIGVSISSTISWNAVSNATGYFISYGTNSSANNITNMIDVGNVLTFNPTNNFPDDVFIYVKITSYNSAGNSVSCSIERFKTEIVVPLCTSLILPKNGSSEVEIDTSLSWNFISNATGYFISIGISPNGNEIANMVDVGNTTFYNPTNDFPDDATIYVTITPYNSVGNPIGSCSQESFKIQNRQIVTPKFFTPNGDGFNDVWKIYDPKNEVKAIYIFDRYGKLLYNISNANGSWNGTFGNQILPATDYWFSIERKQGEPIKGHFSLIR